MLTKDLVRARVVGGYLKPQFVDPRDPALLDLADQLLALFADDQGVTRGEIDEGAEPLLNGYRDPRLAKGLYKLLHDRSTFSHALDLDYPAMRQQLFRLSARRLKEPGDLDYERYRDAILAEAALPPEFVARGIYADLPENEELMAFRGMEPGQLLERYNVGLVQALLLQASDLNLVVQSPDPAKLRRLFKYLKFFRLLGRLFRHDQQADTLRLEVSGPASVLDNSRKYGLQLASFFPAVCALDHWRLSTTVAWKERPRELRLGEEHGLVCPYRNFSAYVPEEIRLFHRHFKETVTTWEIVGDTPFLDAGSQELIFPDLSFRHGDGTTIHLELFHRWHANQLDQRLAHGASHPDLPLIVGVDRALASKPTMDARLQASPWFARHGFLFRDYPSVNRVQDTLDSLHRSSP